MGDYTFQLRRDGYMPSDVAITVRRGEQRLSLRSVALSPQPKERYALLVGVNRPGNELPHFIHAEADVAELGPPPCRRRLPGEERRRPHQNARREGADLHPTARHIRTQLEGLTKKCRSGDSVLVALVGHTVQPDKGGPSHFCPVEAVLNNEDKLVSLAHVYDQLDRCPAGSKLLVLDCWRKNLPQGTAGPAARVAGGPAG